MSKHTIIFHNFPSCSILLDEIVMNNQLGADVEFKTLNVVDETIQYVKENPRTCIIFYNVTPTDYIRVKSILKELKTFLGSPVCAMAIVKNSDSTVKDSLKELGVRDIFSHNFHSNDIIEKIDQYISSSKLKEKPIETAESKKQNDENILNHVVDNNDYRQEEFSQVISEAINAKDINLDSGNLAIDLETDQKLNGIVSCSIENFEANQIEIALEGQNNFKKEDSIKLNINFQYNRCKVELMIDGIIEENEHTSEDGCVLTIKLSNDESISLENFMSLYQQRQKNIDNFMISAKGL